MQPLAAPQSQGPSLALGDIYYALFRHKWKIALATVVGILAAAAYFVRFPPPYQSEAKLFIRYVTETKGIAPAADDIRTKSPDQRGETIMNSEVEILTSMDLAQQVATAIGPARIVAPDGKSNNLNAAAAYVRKHLIVDIPARSSVIRLVFSHPDPEITQSVLREIIAQYLTMHVEIHRAVGIVGDFLTQETDQLRARLAQTEEELHKARAKAGIISLEDSKRTYTEQIANVRQEILSAQAEFAERSAAFQELTKNLPKQAGTSVPAASAPVPDDKLAAYRNVTSWIEMLNKKRQDLLTTFTPESQRVKDIDSSLAEAQLKKAKLEEEYPALLRTAAAVAAVPGLAPAASNAIDLPTEAARLTALDSKIKVLNAQLDSLRKEAASIDEMEVSILDLRRKKELQEENYKYYASSLEQARIDEALGSGRVSNINAVQNPSPPFLDRKKQEKIAVGLAFAGIAGGLAWALLIELYLDRTIRRPIDVERKLRMPLFLSIPDVNWRGHRRLLRNLTDEQRPALPPASEKPMLNGKATLAVANGRIDALHPFYETLRDRLIGYFESRNLTHKPKLVAMTGLGRNSGVSTVASGLASCLSETGEGNVLLVDMTVEQGSAEQFYHGKKVCGLEEILETRRSAQIQDKLFVVGEDGSGADRLSRILPQRFNQIVPKLKASDFDYIIFDMPPVSQISITPRLAGYMDMVLINIESEKTDQDLLQRATQLLSQSNAPVGAILNKTKTYVPPSLHQEYLGDAL